MLSRRPILTPPISTTPRINNVKVFGVRPGSPFLFQIAATGQKPLRYMVDHLPDGLHLDQTTGIITGTVQQSGSYQVTLKVSNTIGATEKKLQIECSEQICLTPPMGWNSWYVYSIYVSQEKVLRQARAMKNSGLIDHGWTYINIDDGWQGQRDNSSKALQPNDKFPDIKRMVDEIHQLGLKAGIYSGPWIGTYAGYIGSSALNEQLDYSDLIVPEEDRLEKNQIFGNFIPHRRRGWKFGIYLGDNDARQWATWGFDYLKYDWNPNDISTARRMFVDIRKNPRDIIYSLSNNAPFSQASEWARISNLWRTSGDIIDNWFRVASIGFSQERWQSFGGPGHWNDPDMLQIGETAHPHQSTEKTFPSHLTAWEQYSQMSLWCLLSAPLLLSCDLEKLDPFTLNLLTNDEVLEINQDPIGKPAHRIKHKIILKNIFEYEIWSKELENGRLAVGFFNRGQFPVRIQIKLNELGLIGHHLVRDLWRQQYIGLFHKTFMTKVPKHGVMLMKFEVVKV